MSSPKSNADEEGGEKKYEQVTFRFCSECSNMLYPKEDEDMHKLQYTCRTCQYTEEAQSSCVFRNILNNTSGETAGVTQDVGSDPTVSALSPLICLCCGTPIYCISCGEFSPDLTCRRGEQRERDQREPDQSMAMCQFNLLCGIGDDPFAEYDEELMPEDDFPSDRSDSMDDSISESSEIFCSDGAMIIDI